MEDVQELMNKMENENNTDYKIIVKTSGKEIPYAVMENLNKKIATIGDLDPKIATSIVEDLNKKISTTVNESSNKEAPNTLNQTQKQLASLVYAGPVSCEEPEDYVINIDLQIIKHFDLDSPRDGDFIFDTGCLHACLEECSIEVCHLPISTHVVKVVGAIPYGYSINEALTSSNACGSGNIDLCYQDYVCVDAPRCCYADDPTSGAINPDAETARDNMETDLQDCERFSWFAIAILIYSLNAVLYLSAIRLPDCRVED